MCTASGPHNLAAFYHPSAGAAAAFLPCHCRPHEPQPVYSRNPLPHPPPRRHCRPGPVYVWPLRLDVLVQRPNRCGRPCLPGGPSLHHHVHLPSCRCTHVPTSSNKAELIRGHVLATTTSTCLSYPLPRVLVYSHHPLHFRSESRAFARPSLPDHHLLVNGTRAVCVCACVRVCVCACVCVWMCVRAFICHHGRGVFPCRLRCSHACAPNFPGTSRKNPCRRVHNMLQIFKSKSDTTQTYFLMSSSFEATSRIWPDSNSGPG